MLLIAPSRRRCRRSTDKTSEQGCAWLTWLVQLAYLDESRTAKAFHITALCVSDVDAIPLGRDLDGVVEFAQDNFGKIRSNAELHGYAIASAKDDWTSFQTKMQARVDVYQRAVEVIASYDVRAYIRGVTLRGHRSRYGSLKDPHETVLPWVLERVQEDAVRKQDVVLAIADEVSTQDRFRANVREYQQYGTWGWRSTTLDRIADTIHFAPSKASRLLQAADLVSYAHAQSRRTHPNAQAEAAYRRIWDTLLPRVKHNSTWSG